MNVNFKEEKAVQRSYKRKNLFLDTVCKRKVNMEGKRKLCTEDKRKLDSEHKRKLEIRDKWR